MEAEKFSLDNVLSQEVETPPVAVLSPDYQEPDFDDIEDFETEQVSTQNNRVYDEIPSDEQPHAMPYSHLAELGVGMFDMLQNILLPIAKRKIMFTPKEIEILEQMDTTGGTIYPEKSTQAILMVKWNQLQKFTEKISLTEKERDFLVKSTERYAATMQMTVTPLQGLLMAYGTVIGSRVNLVFND